jgi:sortase (surface protein transpeptidase)
MAFRSRINRRLALPFILAVVLASEVTGLAVAARLQPLPSAAPAGVSVAHVSASASRQHSARASSLASVSVRVSTTPSATAESRIRAPSRNAAPARPVIAAPANSSPVAKSTRAKAAPAAPSYHGRNHVWIPKLGINRSIASFPCSRSRPPDNYIYRWGCAGRNNIYLLGHAYSVFKPLHDAYVGGRLKKGMKVIYADGSGRVRTYSVIWWKVTRPTTSSSWAWAAQSRPSMTLQTCLGARSELRLIVRLVAVG